MIGSFHLLSLSYELSFYLFIVLCVGGRYLLSKLTNFCDLSSSSLTLSSAVSMFIFRSSYTACGCTHVPCLSLWGSAETCPDTNRRRHVRRTVSLVLLLQGSCKLLLCPLHSPQPGAPYIVRFSHSCIRWERQSAYYNCTISCGVRPSQASLYASSTVGLANIFSKGLGHISVFRPSVLKSIYEY